VVPAERTPVCSPLCTRFLEMSTGSIRLTVSPLDQLVPHRAETGSAGTRVEYCPFHF